MNPENVLRGWMSEVAGSSDVEVSLFADRGSEAWAAVPGDRSQQPSCGLR